MYVYMYVCLCVCKYTLAIIFTTCVGAGDNRLANFRFRQVSTYVYYYIVLQVYVYMKYMCIYSTIRDFVTVFVSDLTLTSAIQHPLFTTLILTLYIHTVAD